MGFFALVYSTLASFLGDLSRDEMDWNGNVIENHRKMVV